MTRIIVVNKKEILRNSSLTEGSIDDYGTVDTLALSGGQLIVEAGAVAKFVTLTGGEEIVLARGRDVSAQIKGGRQKVYGVASGAVLTQGLQDVYGLAVDTVVVGGQLVIESGGKASAVLLNGGQELVQAGGVDVGAKVQESRQIVYGAARNVGLFANGVQEVHGLATGTCVFGGSLIVEAGGTAKGASIGFGEEQVRVGGEDDGATIGRGVQNVEGLAVGAKILAGGLQVVYGTAKDTLVRGATAEFGRGAQEVYGTAFNSDVNGGLDYIHSGGCADGTTKVRHGGELHMDSAATLLGGVLLGQGGRLMLDADLLGGGGVTVESGAAAKIDLAGFAFDAAHSAYELLNGVLAVSEGDARRSLQLSPLNDAARISLGGDGHGGTMVTILNKA